MVIEEKEVKNMDNTTIITIITLIGAASGTIIPYIIKTWKDKAIKFDGNYAYALVIGMVIQAAALIPDEVAAITIKGAIMAFSAGYGLQSMINRAVPKGS